MLIILEESSTGCSSYASSIRKLNSIFQCFDGLCQLLNFFFQSILSITITMQSLYYHGKFGDDFLFHFVSKGLSGAHCPPDLAEQYRQKLQSDDIKALKSFYQSFIENLRLLQNGSLVFR